jgi:PAS domain S-box-containing protein
VKILLVEDNPGDARLIRVYLTEAGIPALELVHAGRLDESLSLVRETDFDIVLLDLSLPDASGLEGLSKMREAATTHPIVVLTGLNDEVVALEALRKGAQDYLIKDQIGNVLLARSIRYAIERKRIEVELAGEAERASMLFEDAPDASTLTDLQGTIIDGNRAAEKLFGYRHEELVGKNLLKLDLLPMSEVTKLTGLLVRNAFGQATGPDELLMRSGDGTPVMVEICTHVVTVRGRKAVLSSMRDITERKRIELAMRERVRELDCMYGLARLVEKPAISLDELLRGVANLLADALKRAEVGGARVSFDDREYRTPDWEDTTLRIKEPLRVDGVEAGVVELGYLPNVGESGLRFLPEEHNLLFAVATRLGRMLESLHAAAALQESEEKYRLLVDNAAEALIVLDDWKVVLANPCASEITGYAHQELIGRTFVDSVHPEDRAAVADRYRRRLAGEDIRGRHVFRFVRRDGEIRYVETSAVRMKWRGGPAVLHFLADTTERKRAEDALRESEERLRTITDSAKDAIIMMDDSGLITFWNPAAEATFGYAATEVIGRKLHEFLVPERFRATHDSVFGRFQATGEGEAVNKTTEFAAIRRDGTEIPAELSLSAIKVANKWHSVGIVRDITARKQAEEEIRQKNAQLLELNSEKNKLLGMAAHDLRNPLSIVSTASAYLLSDASRNLPEAKRTEFIRRINSGSRFMLKLIDDLQDVAKIEEGRLDLELKSGDLCGLIEENMALNRMLAENKRIRLEFAPVPGLPPLRFDRDKIDQVLNNLISNALKFSAPETVVTIQASRVNANIVVSVRDQGQGIPAAELDKLFKPFGKTSVRGTAGEKSTGLGLAICRKIVEGHGGRIWAESEVGKGSVFSFGLPIAGQS